MSAWAMSAALAHTVQQQSTRAAGGETLSKMTHLTGFTRAPLPAPPLRTLKHRQDCCALSNEAEAGPWHARASPPLHNTAVAT
jgi:hypothetical protein